MTSLKRIDYVILYVENLSKSVDFYRDVVGLDLKFEQEETGYAEFVSESCKFGLYSKDRLPELIGTQAREGSLSSELVFIVDDVDEQAERLVGTGAEILSGPKDRPWGHRTLHFLDPDGNIVEFAQEIARQTQE